MKYALFILLLTSTCSELHAQVRLPRLVSDSMVLQRDKKIKIWGWAAPGEEIKIRIAGQQHKVRATAQGKWMVNLSPLKAGGPFEMAITASNSIVLRDIMVGDIWICSGQSNMEISMERVKDKYPEEMNAGNTNIRQFNVATRFEFDGPLEDLASGRWETFTPGQIRGFTAVGYFFAKALYEKYKVPIGLIESAAGGAPAEAWLSEDALAQFPTHLATALRYRNKSFVDSIRKADQSMNNLWYSATWHEDKGSQSEKKWYDISYHPENWASILVPGYWSDQGFGNINGVGWYRKEFELPATAANMPARLLLGNAVDRDSVYVNGVFVGTTGYQYPPRKYNIPAGVLKEGKNIIVVRVINSSGKGGFYIGKPYQLITGSDTTELAGEWQFKIGMVSPPISPTVTFQYQPMSLFNGMIAPLLNFGIKGVIWYQGEANTSKAAEYRKIFPAVITNWRNKWQQGVFPFLYVQLHNYGAAKQQPSGSQWAELREAQLHSLVTPNTAMVVSIDVGEWNDLHPVTKKDVGVRLSLAARKMAYGEKKLVFSGPIYQSMKIDGNKIVIRFTHTGSGLVAKDGPLREFAIAGADKKFAWASARIEGNTVVLWSDQINKPVAVRYAWADNPEGANLYNKEGLPASPFRTDH